jgi:hypothetical protein
MTRKLAGSGNIAYLLASTALGEIGAWLDTAHCGASS